MPPRQSFFANHIPAGVTLTAALMACAVACHHTAPQLPTLAEPTPEARPAAMRAMRADLLQPAPGLVSLACGSQVCAWSGPDGLTVLRAGALAPVAPPLGLPFPAESLAADGEGFLLAGPCEQAARCQARVTLTEGAWRIGPAEPLPAAEPPAADDAAATTGTAAELARWRGILGHGRRIPFARSVPVAGGGVVSYRRAMGVGGGLLARIGPGILNVDAPSPGAEVSCEGWLAPHPGGQEVYLLLWPRPELAAYEAQRLAQRWSLPLPGPAQGLFVDPAGRFALLSETSPADDERLTDHPALPLPGPSPAEPLMGIAVMPPDAPAPVATLLIDLGGPAVAARVEGAFRAWQQTPDGAMLLATDQAILRLVAP
ncbi:MAG: hypothetical protein ABIO70_05605 [Pseudomonadota bacterium]